jgi:putative aldouronate transport system permease protein
MYFVLIASFSDPVFVNSGQVFLIPKGITLQGYEKIFEYQKIWTGYRNTIIYTVVGTSINVIMTILAAYPLSRPDFAGRKPLMFVFVLTNFFSGGLIPTFLLIKNLNILNTLWVMVLPPALSVYNMIIARTFFMHTIPGELLDAASLDGCGNTRFLTSVVLPLSMPIIAVLALYYAVYHWNSYFNAMIYLSDDKRYSLQLILREILIELNIQDTMMDTMDFYERQKTADLVRYVSIVVAIIPMMILYPFLQRYFVKGVMIGSLKG